MGMANYARNGQNGKKRLAGKAHKATGQVARHGGMARRGGNVGISAGDPSAGDKATTSGGSSISNTTPQRKA